MLSTVTCMIGPRDASGKFIDTNGQNGVIIDCLQYISGTKNINVYTNKTVQNYELRLNGTLLNSAAHPKKYINGRWYTDWVDLVQGENPAGNLRYCDVQDTNYLYCQSQTVASAWLLGVPIDWDEFINQQFCWGTGNKDTSYINATWIEYRIELTRETAGTEDKVLQYWRTSDSTWQTFATLTENAWSTGNVSLAVMSNIGAIDKSFWIRVYCHENTADRELQINVDYLRIYYTSTQVLSNERDYSLVDTYSLNSVAKTDGVYNLTARIKDFHGTWWTNMKWIVIDNTPPTVASITLTPSSGLNNTIPIRVYTTLSDTYLNYSYGQYSNGYTIMQIPNDNNAIFNFTNFYTNRSYNFYVYAFDKAGNSAYKNKTFTVAFKKYIEYIQNPIIDVSHTDKSYPGTTAWTNVTCVRVGEMKRYVNGTLNATVASPTTVKYGFNSSTAPRKFNVVLRFTYSNGTWYKNISYTINFVTIPIIYINNPNIDLSYQSNQYVSYTAWVNVTCKYVSQLKMYVNGTLNQTVTNPSTFKYGFNSSTPKNFNVVIRTTYSNGTFYRNDSFVIRFKPWVIQYIHNPSIDVSYISKLYVGQTSWINVTCVNVGEMKRYVNGTLNATVASPTTVKYGLNSSKTKIFNVVLRFTYTNGTWFKNISFTVQFINYTYIYVHEPTVAIGVTLKANITTFNYLIVISEHLGGMNMTIYSWTNMTTTLTNYSNCSSLVIPLKSYIVDVWNITLYFYHPNGTFYKSFNLGMNFENWTIVHEYINNPNIEISYQANQYVNQTSWLNVACQNVGEMKRYVNGTLNATVTSPTTVKYGFNSSTPKIFNVVMRFTYLSNGSWYKNVSITIQFKNVLINQTIVNNPIIDIGYQSKQMINNSAWVNVTCDFVSQIKLYLNGTLNSTFSGNPTGFNWSIVSYLPYTQYIVLEAFFENTSFYKNFSLTIEFFNNEIVNEYLPEINIAYISVQNVTRTAWINVTFVELSQVKLYLNGTLNNTFSSSFDFGLNSSSARKFVVVLQTFYVNTSFYQNFTFNVEFINMSIIYRYVNLPSINIAYTGKQQIDNLAWVNSTFSYIQKIKLYLNGTLNSTFYSNFNWSISSNVISIQSIMLQAFYQNGSWYKNFSISIEFTNDIMYIYEPIVLISSDGYQYVNKLAYVNISAFHVSLIKVYVNGSLNASYSSGFSDIAWSMNYTSVAVFNITVEAFYENSSFFKNFSIAIHYVGYLIINLPIFNMFYQNVTYIGSYTSINVTAKYLSLIKVYVNGSLNASYSNPSTFVWKSIYNTKVNLSIILQTFYLNSSFYKNFSVFIEFKETPIYTVYITNPNIDISYMSTQYINKLAWVNVTFSHLSQVKLRVNGTLNNSYVSSFNWSITSSSLVTYKIILETFYENASFYQNFTLFIQFVNYTYIINPYLNIVCQTEKLVNTAAWINVTTRFIGTVKFYLNNTLNLTTVGSVNYSIYSSTVKDFEVKIEAFHSNGTFFRNITLVVSFVNLQVINVSYNLPSYVVSYSSYLFKDQAGAIQINTTNSARLDVDISNGSSFVYYGNQSLLLPIPSDVLGNVNFSFNIYYTNGSSWKNITSIIYIISPFISIEFIDIQYENIAYVGTHATFEGNANFLFNITITEEGNMVYSRNNIYSFTYKTDTYTKEDQVLYEIDVYANGTLIYYQSVTVNVVLKPTTSGGGGGGGGGGFPFIFQLADPATWIWLLGFGSLGIILIAVFGKRKKEPEEKSTYRTYKKRKPFTPTKRKKPVSRKRPVSRKSSWH